MRSRYVVAVVAILAIGFAIKWFFFSTPTADASANSRMDIPDMHRQVKNLPLLDVKDPN
jgi:hypothetical protein